MTVRAGGRRQIAVWSVLLLLVVAIVAIDRFGADDAGDGHGHGGAEVRMLFPAPIDDIAVVEVASGGTIHKFERDGAGAWFYHAHDTAPASEDDHAHQTDPDAAATIEQALAAFGRTRIERQLPSSDDLSDYGVTAPAVLINLYGTDDRLEPLARYAVGDVAPDTVSRYVMPVGSFAVVTIPSYQIEHLQALVDEVGGAALSR